jgi:alkylhydroperoxidase family enzyme
VPVVEWVLAERRHFDDGEIVELRTMIALFGFLKPVERHAGD